MTEYAYSRNDPSISVAKSMSTMRSTRSSGGRSGVAGRRAMLLAPRGRSAVRRPLWTVRDPRRARRAGPRPREAAGRNSVTFMADVTVDGDPPPAPAYPAGWEADVVLQDGSTTHVRPLRPDDADALQAFHV